MKSIIDINGYDYVDFGCSKGGSLRYAKRVFNAERGLGIDLNPEKVKQALNDGENAVVADATKSVGLTQDFEAPAEHHGFLL